ncbi:MAG: hypothetical protein KatS3mg119_0625 [Rhodothalassiaceae bacterium]|nr:MAG: hypothetical protein KatS3mg119_0625 [Rhodothalassiaceae bacterium]
MEKSIGRANGRRKRATQLVLLVMSLFGAGWLSGEPREAKGQVNDNVAAKGLKTTSSSMCSRMKAGIVVLAPNCLLAERGLQEALHARKIFVERFGVMPGQGAVVDVGVASAAHTLLDKTEWKVLWPLAPSSGKGAPPGGAAIALEGGLAHELGHEWFTTYLWPATTGNQYGGDAPDWLDELAAIVTEPPEDAARNTRIMRGFAGMAPCRLAPLFQAVHPALAAARRQAGGNQGTDNGAGQQVITFTMRADGAGPDNPLVFYGQIRALAQFILDKAPRGDGIFGRLARALKAGKRFGDWLVAEGLIEAKDPTAAEEQFEAAWCAAQGWSR